MCEAGTLGQVLGRSTTLALAKAMGGERLYIPLTGRDTRALKVIGPIALALLQDRWGGKELRVPTVAALARAERNAEIRRLAAAGVPPGQIAERVGLTRQRVWQVLKDAA